jgi:hypothetical protein
VALAALLTTPAAHARVIKAGPYEVHKNLHEAMAAAKPGDTIEVEPGTYFRTRIGNHRTVRAAQPSQTAAAAVRVQGVTYHMGNNDTADGIQVENVTGGSGNGIAAHAKSNILVKNCIARNNRDSGIGASASDWVRFGPNNRSSGNNKLVKDQTVPQYSAGMKFYNMAPRGSRPDRFRINNWSRLAMFDNIIAETNSNGVDGGGINVDRIYITTEVKILGNNILDNGGPGIAVKAIYNNAKVIVNSNKLNNNGLTNSGGRIQIAVNGDAVVRCENEQASIDKRSIITLVKLNNASGFTGFKKTGISGNWKMQWVNGDYKWTRLP